MSPFYLDMLSDCPRDMEVGLGLIYQGNGPGAIGWFVHEGMLVLLWGKHDAPDSAGWLPFAMDAKMSAEFALQWLKGATYGREPDHDGDNKKGWRMVSGTFHGPNHMLVRSALVTITPTWTTYGK